MLVASAAACTSSTGAPVVPSSTEKRGPTGTVPAGLERFYGQSLVWGDCAPFARTDDDRATFKDPNARCARLLVPLDYANPAGSTITLGLLRIPATDQGRRMGSLVLNPGGPGASGLGTAVRMAAKAKGSELGKRFDFVGFDPRGVGSSEPSIRCLTDQERDAERADDDELDSTPQGVAKVEAEQKDFATKCVQRTGDGAALLASMGTRDVVKDMDVLRSVLGDEKLTYLGFSYGTRLGTTYAETFPKNVRAMVLDGALDPEQGVVEELVAQGEGFQQAFNAFTQWCVRRQDCALGQDPALVLRNYLNLIRPLIDRPADLGQDGRKLSYSDATTGVIRALYAEELWETLNKGLADLRRQRPQVLMALADSYFQRDQSGRYSTTQDAFTAVRCVDDTRVTDHALVLEAQQRYKQAAPFLDDGRPASPALDACAFWPVPSTSEPHLPNVQGLPAILVVSTTGDPATPYQAGVNLSKALGGALLTYEATQHTAFLQGNSCVDNAGSAYLVDLTVPPQGIRCA
ncbi:alpha/beta hydrolase [Kibdelosporangium philippinense]|uniref:Alpha/beta hydrolase n=1 Tax=Kibdelosporangium philippinense TaxID=211113 RepID=A0ABS8ZMY0_9PSEU|nr:alpha/beta hydrolase [Kibdelosporangium philippinense]MCE7008305.1 alpha/beta hydrolase [Kibdelosporangium philippinense]